MGREESGRYKLAGCNLQPPKCLKTGLVDLHSSVVF